MPATSGALPTTLEVAVKTTHRVRSDSTAAMWSGPSASVARSGSAKRTTAPARSAAITQGRTFPSWSNRVTTTSSPGPRPRPTAAAKRMVSEVMDSPNTMPSASPPSSSPATSRVAHTRSSVARACGKGPWALAGSPDRHHAAAASMAVSTAWVPAGPSRRTQSSRSPGKRSRSTPPRVRHPGGEQECDPVTTAPSPALRREDDGHVRRLVLCRPGEYNTITPALRDELGAALDEAERDDEVRAVLLCAEGPAFCAGFGLDWSTAGGGAPRERVWDTVADVEMIGPFGRTFARLHEISKPTIAAVQGWCIAGGTDMVLNADLIVAGRSARFGYPPARVWGVPEAPWVWVARLGLERAKRYLFTGDEIPAEEAASMGMILEEIGRA